MIFFVPGTDTVSFTCDTVVERVTEGGKFVCAAQSGLFDIIVDSEHVLANIKRRVELPDPGDPDIVDFGNLLEGDANDDGIVDILDFTTLVDSFFRCVGDPIFDPSVDLDRTGCVNIVDFTLLSKNFLIREPVPVP